MKMKKTTVKTGVYTYNNEDHNFNFYTNLSALEKVNFVNSVVDTIIDDTSYNSIIRDEIFDFMLIRTMTDISTSDFSLDDIENFLYSTSVVDIVKANAEPNLIRELFEAVNKSIEYRTGIHSNPISESISSLLNTIEKKIEQIDLSNLDNMMEVISKFTGMTDEFTVDNVVNAYMNSDLHKKNLDEIAEAKLEEKKSSDNVVKLEDARVNKQED